MANKQRTLTCGACGEKYMPSEQSAECPHKRAVDLMANDEGLLLTRAVEFLHYLQSVWEAQYVTSFQDENADGEIREYCSLDIEEDEYNEIREKLVKWQAQLAHCEPLIENDAYMRGWRKGNELKQKRLDIKLNRAKKAERERVLNKMRTYTGSYIDKRFWLCKFWQALKDS